MKIPLQALATVLIVVLALHVYRSVEPETKVVQAPSEASRPVFKGDVEQEYGKAGVAPRTPERKAVVGGQREKSAATLATVPHAESVEARGRAEAPLPTSSAAESAKTEKREAVADKQVQEMKPATPSLSQKETPQIQKTLPSTLARREPDSTGSAGVQATMEEAGNVAGRRAAREAKTSAVKKAEPINFTLRVNDVGAAAAETEKLLGQLGAHSIVTESRDSTEVITSELAVQKVEELSRKLTAVGHAEEKGSRPAVTEGDVSVRIELFVKP